MSDRDDSSGVRTILGIYLILSVIAFLYLLIEFWPIIDVSGPKPVWDGTVQLWQGKPVPIPDEIRVLILVILSAAVGSYIHASTSFVTYVGNKSFVPSWTWWYVLRPFIGMPLAVVFYFVIRGGLLTVQSEAADFNPYGIAAVAGLVGLFSKQATDKLEEVFTNMFQTAADKGDGLRRNKLSESVPVTEHMVPIKKMRKVLLPSDKTEKDIELAQLFAIIDEGFTRVPVLDENNVCRFIIHQSLVYRFVARKSIDPSSTQPVDIKTLTLEQFLAFGDVLSYVHDAIAFVPPTVTLGEARTEMGKDEDCQDVLVTATGKREEAVIGWLTNVDIAKHIGTEKGRKA